MLKTCFLVIGILLPGVAFSLDIPTIDLEGFLPKEVEGKFQCGHRALEDIGSLSGDDVYRRYASYASSALIWKENLAHRKDLYVSIHKLVYAELAANPEAKLLRQRGNLEEWDVPLELEGVVYSWSRDLTGNKQSIERDICRLDWYERQMKKYSSIPSEFVAAYNSLYDSYMEVKNRCVKPDIQGWTEDQEAQGYVECMQGTAREHNELLRRLKSYQSLRQSYAPILEKLGVEHQLRPSFVYR